MRPGKSKCGLNLDNVCQEEDNRHNDRSYGYQLPGSAGTTVRMLIVIICIGTPTSHRPQTDEWEGNASEDRHEISQRWGEECILVDARDAKFLPRSTSKAGK